MNERGGASDEWVVAEGAGRADTVSSFTAIELIQSKIFMMLSLFITLVFEWCKHYVDKVSYARDAYSDALTVSLLDVIKIIQGYKIARAYLDKLRDSVIWFYLWCDQNHLLSDFSCNSLEALFAWKPSIGMDLAQVLMIFMGEYWDRDDDDIPPEWRIKDRGQFLAMQKAFDRYF